MTERPLELRNAGEYRQHHPARRCGRVGSWVAGEVRFINKIFDIAA